MYFEILETATLHQLALLCQVRSHLRNPDLYYHHQAYRPREMPPSLVTNLPLTFISTERAVLCHGIGDAFCISNDGNA